MHNVIYFNDLLGSIPHYRKIVLLMFLIEKDNDILTKSGFLKTDVIRLRREYKTVLIEQNEAYLNDIRNQEESFCEKILNNKWNNILLRCLKMLDMRDR